MKEIKLRKINLWSDRESNPGQPTLCTWSFSVSSAYSFARFKIFLPSIQNYLRLPSRSIKLILIFLCLHWHSSMGHESRYCTIMYFNTGSGSCSCVFGRVFASTSCCGPESLNEKVLVFWWSSPDFRSVSYLGWLRSKLEINGWRFTAHVHASNFVHVPVWISYTGFLWFSMISHRWKNAIEKTEDREEQCACLQGKSY